MSDTETHEPENLNNDIEITEEELREFQAFQAQKQAKKTRSQNKRITKAGNPDKRSESSKANVSKAREKVKEYLSMSKAVLDEDTDEEYIEIAVKKKEKKPVKYMDTVKYEEKEPKNSKDEPPVIPPTPPPTPVQQPQPKKNSFLKF